MFALKNKNKSTGREKFVEPSSIFLTRKEKTKDVKLATIQNVLKHTVGKNQRSQ